MKKLLSLILLLATSLTALATENRVDLGAMELDVEYSLEDFKNYIGTFTAPRTGVVTCSANTNDVMYPYKQVLDEMGKEGNLYDVTMNQLYGGRSYDFNVEEGKTYIMYASFIMNSGTVFKMTMADEIAVELVGSSPAIGGTFNVSNGGQISFDFNKPINYSGATLAVGDKSTKISGSTTTSSIFFDVKSVVWDWLSSGVAKSGDEIALTINGVCLASDKSVKYNGDGTFVAKFVLGPMPISLVSTENTSGDFLSFYATTNPAGVVKLNFSGKVSADQLSAQLRYGDIEGEDGEYYVETFKPTVSEDGKSISINLQGKRRKAIDMVTSGTNYGTVALGFTGVFDEHGNYAYASGQGSLGSYWYLYDYKEIKAEVYWEFTPADGASLKNNNSIEIWVTDEEKLSYSGILFEYEKDGTKGSVVVTDIAKEQDPEDATAKILTVSLPNALVGAKNIKVSFKNLECADGTDYSEKLVATYTEGPAEASLIVTAISPAEGAKVKGIAKGEYVKFSTNKDDIVKGVQYEYLDATTGKSLYTTFATSYDSEEKCWAIKNYSSAVSDFTKGHVIKFVVNAYDEPRPSSIKIGSDTITWIGDGSEEYQYSSVEAVSITPENGSQISSVSDNEFVITYSAPVEIDKVRSVIVTGQMSTAAFESITPNEDKTVWTLKVSEEVIAQTTPQLYLNVYVKDANGLTLRGNSAGALELEESSYYKYKYICYLGSPDLVITPEAGVVESLKDFSIKYDGGIFRSFTSSAPIEILGKDGNVVASVDLNDVKAGGTTASFSLDKEITKGGTYTLRIPQGIFSLGTEFEGYTNKTQTVEYTIEGGEEEEGLKLTSVTPAAGSTHEMMPNISATFSEVVGYVNYVITDKTVAESDPEMAIVMSGDLKKQDDGSWVTKYLAMYEIKLYEGHTYEVKITAYNTEDDCNYGNAPMGVFTVDIFGASKTYEYAEATLVSVTPEPYTTISTGEIVATFSSPIESLTAVVNDGLFGDTPCTAVANADKTVWTVTIPQSKLNASTGSLNVIAIAKDADGKVVKGNYGEEEDSYFEWSYNCYLGAPDFTIEPASGTKVEKIETITASYSGGINFSYNSIEQILVKKDGEVVVTVPNANITFNTDYTTATIRLSEAITEPGTYEVVFPAMFFILGEEYSSVMSKEQKAVYTIEVPTEIDSIASNKAMVNGKYIENGSVVIVKNGVKYSVTGIRK